METKNSKGRFVRLTYETLSRTDLTLSEKVILDYRNGFIKKFWAGNGHMSEVLGIPLKTVKNRVTSLRKKGLWREVDQRPKKGLVRPKTGLVIDSLSPKEGLSESQNEVHNNPVSPLKTEGGLDSDKIENPERSLERNPLGNGLDTDPQTEGLKKDIIQSQLFVSITKDEETWFTSSLGNVPRTDPNGRRLTKEEMRSANFDTLFENKGLVPYSEEDIRRGI